MTINSVGFAGTVSDAQWANMVARVGSAFYSVDDFASFRVTTAVGVRNLQVAPGGASAFGIYAVSDAVENLTLPAAASGVRWDLIVLRRNWSTKKSTIEIIPGGSTRALPPRTVTPGTLVDQPLALVCVAAGSTGIVEIADVRCIVHNGGAMAYDDLARSYLTHIGTEIRIGNLVWNRVTNAGGTPSWVSTDVTDSSWVAVPRSAKWVGVAGYATQVRRVGAACQLRGAVKAEAGASFASLAVVPAQFRPSANTALGATVFSMSGTSIVAELFLQTTGIVWVSQDYRTPGSLPVNSIIMLHGSWLVG